MITLTNFSLLKIKNNRRTANYLGLISCGIAVFLCLCLISYHSGDPSLNRSTGAEVQNIMGVNGAIIADLLLQLFGVASGVLVVCCASWGYRLMSDGAIKLFGVRICALIIALISTAGLWHNISPPDAWVFAGGMGGKIGYVVFGSITSMMPSLFANLLLLVISAIASAFAFALKIEEWRFLGDNVKKSGGYVGYGLRLLHNIVRNDALVLPSDAITTNRVAPPKQPKLKEDKSPKEKVQRKVMKQSSNDASAQPSLDLSVKKGDYELPALSLLSEAPKTKTSHINEDALKQNASMLESVLHDFGVKGEIINIRPGPVVTLYELEPAAGTKSSRVIGLADDIARSMSAISTRIAVIAGRNALGIELPNKTRQTVYLREILEHETFAKTKANLPMALGKNIGGDPIVVDLAKMPHLLVAGTTGSGKSVAINTMIASLLYHHTPDTCRFIMIDPKMLELSVYNDIPHLLTPVVTEPAKAVVALKWTVKEMENRYRMMANLGVRNIEGYNNRVKDAVKAGETLSREVQTGFDENGRPIFEKQELDMNPLPFIVVVVDEMADLMLVAGKDIEGSIQRLAQMARAAGIHLIMATQRPSVDVITGVIKANFPTRISFQVTSKIDSRTILGEQGAEQLLGQGDMLYMAGGGRIIRVHGPFMKDEEVEEVVNHLKKQGTPEYISDVTVSEEDGEFYDDGDETEEDKRLYDMAVSIVVRDRKASTSYVQRCLKIGYNRAARLIEKMEREGLISAANATGKREILTPERSDY
jgi:S-DNA-T family DNA segregation ATPase FtsK/SpoIIIE